MIGLYAEHRMSVSKLIELPIGTTISYYKNGKERYLRKIRTNESFPYPWYSMETGQTVPNERIPSDWRILDLPRHANNNAQRNHVRRDKYCAKSRY